MGMRHDTQAWAPAGRLNKVGFSPIEGLLVRVFSYWCGPITWMERLSIGSARAAGHQVTVASRSVILRRM